jgi:hypothetical protein
MDAYPSREHYVYVAQKSGASWTRVGTDKLNIGAVGRGTFAVSAQIAYDGSANMMVCWAEQRNNSSARYQLDVTPQIYCKIWNGSAWNQAGTGSLNQAAGNWARNPSVIYANGAWHVTFTEQTQTGRPVVYAKVYNSGTNSWSLEGPSSLNISANGLDFHPSLATNAARNVLYLCFGEQAAAGQHVLGVCLQYTGGSWARLGGAIAADTTNGSIYNMSPVVLSGSLTVAYSQKTWGNLDQVYLSQWTGSTWVNQLGGSGPPVSREVLNGIRAYGVTQH